MDHFHYAFTFWSVKSCGYSQKLRVYGSVTTVQKQKKLDMIIELFCLKAFYVAEVFVDKVTVVEFLSATEAFLMKAILAAVFSLTGTVELRTSAVVFQICSECCCQHQSEFCAFASESAETVKGVSNVQQNPWRDPPVQQIKCSVARWEWNVYGWMPCPVYFSLTF